MTHTVESVAAVQLDRAARYGKQLVSHLVRRTGSDWSQDADSGWIDLDGWRATVAVENGGLGSTARAPRPP